MILSANEAKDAILRGEDASAKVGDISHQLDRLETVNELGSAPASTPQSSHSLSPTSYQASPALPHGSTLSQPLHIPSTMQPMHPQPMYPMMTPQMMAHQQAIAHQQAYQQAMAQSMPQMHMTEAPQLPMINTSLPVPYPMRDEPVSAGYADPITLAPPPLIHSHSYPNGHQLPSQIHLAAPSTPAIPSPSFGAIGLGHAPHVSSPLATMPISRPPSPTLAHYPIPDQHWYPAMQGEAHRAVSDPASLLAPPRRPSNERSTSDSRADGLPIASRGRSTSVTKPARMVGMTSSVPPSSWPSRAASPEEDEESEEEEAPRKAKRRRSSAGNAANDSAALISEDMRRQLDRIFEDFLNIVCSDCECPLWPG
jgi:hypothetical protein